MSFKSATCILSVIGFTVLASSCGKKTFKNHIAIKVINQSSRVVSAEARLSESASMDGCSSGNSFGRGDVAPGTEQQFAADLKCETNAIRYSTSFTVLPKDNEKPAMWIAHYRNYNSTTQSYETPTIRLKTAPTIGTEYQFVIDGVDTKVKLTEGTVPSADFPKSVMSSPVGFVATSKWTPNEILLKNDRFSSTNEPFRREIDDFSLVLPREPKNALFRISSDEIECFTDWGSKPVACSSGLQTDATGKILAPMKIDRSDSPLLKQEFDRSVVVTCTDSSCTTEGI